MATRSSPAPTRTAPATRPAPGGQSTTPAGAAHPWRPSTAGVAARLAVLAGLLGAVLAVPHVVPGDLHNVVARAAVFGLVALSMNVLMGYAGQVSLGHAAFVGVGAFSAGIVLTNAGLPYLPALAVAGLTGAVAALALGFVALRIRGLYLALVTIAYGFFVQEFLFNIRALTGGGAGMPVPRPGFAADDVAFIYFVYGVVALVWVVDWRLTATKAGRAIQALRDDERVAASWGINVTAYKLLAFVVSGVIAGLAGALLASVEGIAVPITFSFSLSLTFVLMAVVGGLGSRAGVVQGGVLFAVLPTLLDKAHENLPWWPFTALWEPLVGAVLLLVTLMFFPGGIAQQQAGLRRWLSFRRFHAPGDVAGATTGGGIGARP